MFKQQLSQKIQQKFSLKQVQQAKLLALTSLEMENRIVLELEENPLLEEIPDLMVEAEMPNEEEMSANSYSNDFHVNYRAQRNALSASDQWRMNYSKSESFHEYLLTQWRMKKLSKEEIYIGEYLIGNMDNDGYIRLDTQTLSGDISINFGKDISVSTIDKILKLIRELDPPGIGASHLQECLLLQLNKKEKIPLRQKAIHILEKHFDLFVKRHYNSISKMYALSGKELKEVVKEITCLNPKPGNVWENYTDKEMHITPDFIVETKDGALVCRINNETNPPDLRINQEYAELLKNRCSNNRNALSFIKKKIEDAQGFVTAIKQRHLILYRVMLIIVEIQQHFFLTGKEQCLKPMRLKEISEKCDHDISTISRATFNKYVQTSWGIFPLRFFFSDFMQNREGESISTREIKAILKSLIEGEDTKCPLTDDVLSCLFQQRGYKVARRTIAKYREQLNIPIARLRKEIQVT